MRNQLLLCAAAFAATACGKPTSTTVASVDSSAVVPAPSLPAAAPLGDTARSVPSAPPAETVYVDRHRPREVPPPRPMPRREPRYADGRDPVDRAPVDRPIDRAPAPEPAPVAPPSARRALPAGTTITTIALDSIHSRYTHVGDVIHVRVGEDVMAEARTVIPAGAIVSLEVTAIDGAPERGEKGTLSLRARDVTVNGATRALSAVASDYQFEMKARGVGAQEIATTGIGAAIGGVVGHIIGGGTGTVVGVVGGAAGGAALAAKNAERDMIVHAGATISLQLTDEYN